MANKKISELTEATSISGAEKIPFALDNNNGSVTVDRLKAYISNDFVGIWDELDEMKEVLAEMAKGSYVSLLKRLGYNDEDIAQYEWFMVHCPNGPKALAQLEADVLYWEQRNEDEDYNYPELGEEYHTMLTLPKYDDTEWSADYADAVDFYYSSKHFNYTSALFAPFFTVEEYNSSLFHMLNASHVMEFWGGVNLRKASTNFMYIPYQRVCGIGRIQGCAPYHLSASTYHLRYIGYCATTKLERSFSSCPYLTNLKNVFLPNASCESAFAITSMGANIEYTELGEWDLSLVSNSDYILRNRHIKNSKITIRLADSNNYSLDNCTLYPGTSLHLILRKDNNVQGNKHFFSLSNVRNLKGAGYDLYLDGEIPNPSDPTTFDFVITKDEDIATEDSSPAKVFCGNIERLIPGQTASHSDLDPLIGASSHILHFGFGRTAYLKLSGMFKGDYVNINSDIETWADRTGKTAGTIATRSTIKDDALAALVSKNYNVLIN